MGRSLPAMFSSELFAVTFKRKDSQEQTSERSGLWRRLQDFQVIFQVYSASVRVDTGASFERNGGPADSG
jgi:hypothetical protein